MRRTLIKGFVVLVCMKQLIKVGYRYIQIEGDNKIIIDAIKGNIQAPWQVHFIIERRIHLMGIASKSMIHHIFHIN